MANLQNSDSGCVSRSYDSDCTRHILEISRTIDDYIAKYEVPKDCELLPSMIKEVCQMKRNKQHESALLLMMVSAKRACQMGWFSTADSLELINLSYEIAKTNPNTVPSRPSLSVISEIMSRFFPRMTMDKIYYYHEIKSGSHNYKHDFRISNVSKFSPEDKIRLFVVKTDNIETSSCLVTPAHAVFFLNRQQVNGRNRIFLDSEPQLPSDLIPLLRNGSNLLQAVGDFNGSYIVSVALMRELPNPDGGSLHYYCHTASSVDADSEVIVRPLEISLNCPIRSKRIKTPVKGSSCKHISCFDYDNYVEINSRKPHWCCPLCNKHECFSDLRLDQNMVKVLKEVDPDVSTVMFNSDGTWAPLIEIKDDDDLVDTMPVPQKVSDVASTSQSLTVYATYQMITTPPHQMGSDVASTSRSQTVGSDHQRFVPGQMRGSLSGQAYNDYYYRTITLPMQQAEAARSRSGRKLN